ncbi:branched-chain amino acid aminotransferase [Bifidobacterium sp. SMB2]|uniref:Branched-chain amino acid aminotransferase n=2 Tax=Bifidobacterium TaxID=1678 RepID=A0ABX0C6L4_9BIFI|nr:branched-chain amino acid aminotransferase [Bifidobacterium sp. SMB2]NEH10814.1 branched-chain amino acid aminotransferase [Bifidobacterium saimiriisciurei]
MNTSARIDGHHGTTGPGGAAGGPGEGYQFGLGVFETVAVRQGRAVMLERHIERLHRGCRAIGVPDPDDTFLRERIDRQLHRLNKQAPGLWASCALKIIASDGELTLTQRPNPYDGWADDRTLKLGWCRAWRNERSPLTFHKTLNQGDNILETRQAKALGLDGAVFVNTRGEICETTNANLFLVRGGVIHTPAGECGLLPGTVRQWVCERRTVAEGRIMVTASHEDAGRRDPFDVGRWDEVFATNALMGVRPVCRIGGAEMPVGPVTRHLMQEYAELLRQYY